MHLAASDVFRKIDGIDKKPLLKKYHLKEPFILYVGGLDYRKNVLNLLKAVVLIREKDGFPYQLVIIGKDVSRKNMPEALEIKGFIAKENLWSNVKLIDFVTGDELIKFYNLAKIFVFPSLYEGYGLPVLEAMQCGTPVACSNILSVKEVAGDAALYFDPDTTENMSKEINTLINNVDLREELRKKGLQQAKKFSWKKAADVAYDSFKR